MTSRGLLREAAIRSACNLVAAICVLTAVTPPSFSQSTQPAGGYDWSTPLAASASLARAMDRHDQATVTSTYHAANDDERALLKALDEQGTAAAELNRACVDRFKRGLPTTVYDASREEADVNGDTATVYPGGRQSGLGIRWVRVKGQWKLPMADVLRVHLMSYNTLENAVAEKRAWTKQLQRTADEVRTGRYGSPEAVNDRLNDLAVADDPPSTQPVGK